jgi:hypothetical protein
VKRDQRIQNLVENGGAGGNPSSVRIQVNAQHPGLLNWRALDAQTLLKEGEYQKDVKRDVPDLALGPVPSVCCSCC